MQKPHARNNLDGLSRLYSFSTLGTLSHHACILVSTTQEYRLYVSWQSHDLHSECKVCKVKLDSGHPSGLMALIGGQGQLGNLYLGMLCYYASLSMHVYAYVYICMQI